MHPWHHPAAPHQDSPQGSSSFGRAHSSRLGSDPRFLPPSEPRSGNGPRTPLRPSLLASTIVTWGSVYGHRGWLQMRQSSFRHRDGGHLTEVDRTEAELSAFG